MDKVIQIEIVLNFLNTLFGKAVYFKDDGIMNELSMMRRGIYYADDFNYELILKELKEKEKALSKYE